ncbi:CAF17-like 4Fe-4S cluster assembly/insertion protein YgfZ [Algiphilus aromaticivorans]|uniref:CAF17-like 4Fe-4S cluster assembly/insertion protein YgfZ n=1 Tax=Algiphilus aromaticivorans TaxID=382454 RepID=UPI0006940079|nr:folate-binding protein YgfZ [Algiphilus aromaticivorans]
MEGEDAQSFLQGQLSNDMRKLAPERAALSSLNSPKGRVLATLIVFPTQSGYGLLIAPDIVEAMQRRLQMFVLRSKVQLIPSEEAVRGYVGDAPPGVEWQIQQGSDDLRIRAPGTPTRSWLVGGGSDAPADESAFAAADIASGLPCVGAAQSDAHIAQHLGLQHFGALSFDKGCFTGQEVIARMHYRGGIKRMPLRLTGSGAPPEPGLTLRSGDGNALAEVVNSVATSDGCEMLVVWRGLEAPEVVECDQGRFEVRAFEARDKEASPS